MSLSIKDAQRLGLIPKSEKPATQNKPYIHSLTKRLLPICARYGWQVDVYRAFCTLPQSPPNTAETVAVPNAVVVWRTGRVAHLGWIWQVSKWSDEQIEARLKELEKQG